MQRTNKRAAALERRIADTTDAAQHKCAVFECGERAGRASGEGLGRYCRKHLKHWRRHGHPTTTSYRASDIAPFRDATSKWLRANRERREVANAIASLEQILAASGRAIEPRHLRGLAAKDRASAIWARIRDRQVSPEAILAIILGVSLCIAADPQRPSHAEFRYVQVAKLLNRMGGGIVRRWEQPPLYDGA